MLDLIPPQFRLAAYALAAALLFASGWTAQGWRLNAHIAQMQADSAQELAAAIAQARSEEQRRQTALEIIRDDANKQISTALSDAAAAHTAAIGLREQVNRLASRKCPSAAGGGETANDPALLLGELFKRADEVAGELAAYADRARIAGQACEASYGALR